MKSGNLVFYFKRFLGVHSAKIHGFLLVLLFPIGNCFADSRNRPIISYFVDNIVFQIIVSGGYYSLAIILGVSTGAYFHKKFREVTLSILLAFVGIFLLIFVYQAFEDFNWLPEVS